MSYIARYFRKDPYSTDEEDRINESDINAFIERKIEESVNLDYKHIDKYKDKIGLGKVITSFANTDGGLLILGVSEKKHLPQKPPTWGDSDKFSRETLEARLFSVIKPEIKGLYIHPVRHSTTSKVIFLIDVPKSNDRPHMSNYMFYARRNFSSDPIGFDRVKSMLLETHMYKQSLLENFFEPIYSDVLEIIENIECDSFDSSHVYKNTLLKNKLLLQKFSDEVLKAKIDEFYNIMDERKDRLDIYESVAGVIINERLKEIIGKYGVEPKFTDVSTPWVQVYATIRYRNMRSGSSTLLLTENLLHQRLGHCLERLSIRSHTIEGYRILTTDDNYFEVPEEEFTAFWEKAMADSEKNDILNYLRESVFVALNLGLEIKKMIEKL